LLHLHDSKDPEVHYWRVGRAGLPGLNQIQPY
jgi:hypothetical protein